MANQPVHGQQYGPGITRIAVTGFKSLAKKTDVEIRPLTVLAGANSSGKSSLMQPLLLMKQTLESSVVPAGPFLLSGPYTQYTEAKQFLSRINNSFLPQLTIDFQLEYGWMAGLTYRVDSDGIFDLIETRGSVDSIETKWTITSNSTSDELKGLFGKIWFPLGSNETTESLTFSAIRSRFYHSIKATLSDSTQFHPNVMAEIKVLVSEIARLIHIPGLRGDQLRKWLLAEVSTTNVYEGPFESYVPSIIEYWQQTNPLISPSINELNAALKLLGLASSVRTLRLNESEVEMCVPRTFDSGDGDYVNVADVGLAVSTVLPVLVALIQAAPGQLVYIEQPELHLHPRAQWRLAQLLAQAANRGVRLVIETHSSLLLQGILTCVAKGTITPENVALHWFSRNEDGVTEVTTAELDEQGRFGDWPADFDRVEMKASNDYLDAMEGKLMAS
jgi:hypothetical protein